MHRSFAVFPLLIALASAAEAQTATAPAANAAAPNVPAAKTAAPNTAAGNKGPTGPTDPKAKKSFDEAAGLMRKHDYIFALEGFRKADKQDGSHCLDCEIQAYLAARTLQDYKAAREEATVLLANVTAARDKATAHSMIADICLSEGVARKQDKALEEADAEFKASLELVPGNATCVYGDGLALAHLKQDDAARLRFEEYLKTAKPSDLNYDRAVRFAEHPEMARARVAPNFRLTTLDGQTLSLESLTGKVVLMDFWATWCGPCREALPHVRRIAKEFQGQPLVVLSVSLDRDEAKWKDFVGKNDMTWLQYRDGYFEGPIAKLFGVTAIPATFTMDGDGVLQDQHVGDAEIEGKLKKLIARADQLAARKTEAAR